jgi:hypothetical protein
MYTYPTLGHSLISNFLKSYMYYHRQNGHFESMCLANFSLLNTRIRVENRIQIQMIILQKDPIILPNVAFYVPVFLLADSDRT